MEVVSDKESCWLSAVVAAIGAMPAVVAATVMVSVVVAAALVVTITVLKLKLVAEVEGVKNASKSMTSLIACAV